MARPPTSPTLVARALAMVDGGMTPEEAAKALAADGERISQRTIYNALEARPSPSKRQRRATPADAEPLEVVAQPPAHLSPIDTDIWIVEQEIQATRVELAKARRGDQGARCAALQEQLRRLMDDRRELRPPPPPTADEEERRWRADADAVVRAIEAGVVERETRGAVVAATEGVKAG